MDFRTYFKEKNIPKVQNHEMNIQSDTYKMN